MAVVPFTGLDSMLDPFESSDPFDVFDPFESFEPLQTYEPLYEPYRYTRYRHHVRRSRRRTVRTTVRRMDRELGKLVSAIKEDDKSFQVIRFYCKNVYLITSHFWIGHGGRHGL